MGISDDLLDGPDFHDLAQVHDRDPIGQHPCQRQVVGDEQVGQSALPAEVEHEPEELGPDRNVEHADGFIRHHHIRVHDEHACDDHPLALAAGQLVGIATREVVRRPEVDCLERRVDLCRALVGRSAQPVDEERFRDVIENGLLRIQRFVRILEDDLDAASVPSERALTPDIADVLPIDNHSPGRLAGQFDEYATGGRLAAPGFADQPQDFAATDGQVDSIYGADDAATAPHQGVQQSAAYRKMDLEALEAHELVCPILGHGPGSMADGRLVTGTPSLPTGYR